MNFSEDHSFDFSFSKNTFQYWEIFLSFLFKYPSRCYELKKKKKEQVLKHSCLDLHQFGNTYRAHSASKGIICQATSKKEDIQKTAQVLSLISEKIEDPLFADLITAEILAKVLAYRNLSRDDHIPIPTLEANGKIEKTFYTVDKVFNLWNKVRAFGLVSSQKGKAPILLFRGTDFSLSSEEGRASIISDLDPKGPGRSLFETAEKNLCRWLKTISLEKGRVRAIGHSLGGVILSYTLLNTPHFMSNQPHEFSYAFNFPGVSKSLVQKWEVLPTCERPNYRGIICRGDVISKFGQLFGNVFEVSLNQPLSPMRAHEFPIFTQPLCYLFEIDLHEENQSDSRQFYSKLHKQTASLIYEFGLKFLFPS